MAGRPANRLASLAAGALLVGSAAAQNPDASAPEELRRRAEWGATFRHAGRDSGVIVTRLAPNSAARAAGLRVGDHVIVLNGRDVRDPAEFRNAQRAIRGGDSVIARLIRTRSIEGGGGDTAAIRFLVPPLAREQIPGTTAAYGVLRSPRGYLLRTLITRPESAGTGRLPAILFVPWLSCDAVEKPDPGGDGFAHLLRDVAAGSGMLLLRVEKPGVGDSDGPDCSEGSLADELAAYRAALAHLRARTDVDTTRIVILGGSLGGSLAPILVAESPDGIVGVISVGGFTKTWFEHMMEIERRRLVLSGQPPVAVNEAMRGFARFYAEYLLGRQTPTQVLTAHPELRQLWYDEPEHQYGRHARYFHELQQLNPEGAWATVAERGIPGLIVWGEFDWIMSRDDQDRAVAILNRRRAGAGTLAVIPRTDHGLMTYPDEASAFADKGAQYDGRAAQAVIAWLRERFAGAGRRP